MKLLIVAGGTGGHFYPGLAVAEAAKRAGHDVSFIVRKGDYVMSLLARSGFPSFTIDAAGFARKIGPGAVLALYRLLSGFVQSIFLIRKIRPDRLLVMGGYLSVPPAVAARALRIPVVLHEQNVIPGLANRLLARLANVVAVSFKESAPRLGHNVVVTGNPVRREFGEFIALDEARRRFGLNAIKTTVLIFGGSLGAKRMNELAVGALAILKGRGMAPQALHIAGPADAAAMKARYRASALAGTVLDYCHDMPAAFSAADFVICRSGASTISELIVARRPAILIPYPFATDDHQTANAAVLADAGAAVVAQQRDLSDERLADLIGEVAGESRREAMASAFASIGVDPMAAADRILTETFS